MPDAALARGDGVPPLVIAAAGDRAAAWDTFVHASPDSTFAHLDGWRRVMNGALGHECLYLVAEQEGEWRGVLPLVRVRGAFGHFLISMPFMNDGGPLGDPAAREALARHALAIARGDAATLLELRSRGRQPGPLVPAMRKVAVLLDLPPTVDALWASTFRAKLRSQIRRAAKEGMQVRIGADQLSAFYQVYAHNMRDLGTPVLPWAFFDAVASAFRDRTVVAAVYSAEGEPVAAGHCSVWRGEMEITWASSIRAYNRYSPNMLLYARLMEEAIGRGLRIFNFGRSTPGAPTHRFKQQWGGRDQMLAWPSWSRRPGAGTPSPERPLFRAAAAIWRGLPLPVANTFGPYLARQLP